MKHLIMQIGITVRYSIGHGYGKNFSVVGHWILNKGVFQELSMHSLRYCQCLPCHATLFPAGDYTLP
jgi:hypothetical protein